MGIRIPQFLPFALVSSAIHLSAATLYVDLNSTNPVAPYGDWTTAATNIQDAVDAATNGDLVLVNDGVYSTGGTIVCGGSWAVVCSGSRVTVDKPVTVQSMNGPSFTSIVGDAGWIGDPGAWTFIRCVYLTNNATLIGFTLTNGAAYGQDSSFCNGGGVCCAGPDAVVSNCVLIANSAQYGYGGGAFGGTLYGCTLISNSSGPYLSGSGGGGACSNHLIRCTLIGNQALSFSGGGSYYSTLDSCTLSSNTAASYGGGACFGSVSNCTFIGNRASDGGGSASNTLIGCWLIGNLATNSGSLGSINAGNGGGTHSATLAECTLAWNNANNNGGGSYNCSLADCTLAGNTAASSGGGVAYCSLFSCVLSNNCAHLGGGAASSSLDNCFVCSNAAPYGGAVSLVPGSVRRYRLVNCTIISNFNTLSAILGILGVVNGTVNATNCIFYNNIGGDINVGAAYSCRISPLPSNGTGNITNEPLFVDIDGGDFHLQPNSPCINAGNNNLVITTTDLDGNPRISGGTVDIGAYEFQNPTSVISYAWLRQYGLPTDGTADYIDPDHDGMNNWQEWRAGTDPTNAGSVLKMLPLASTNNSTGLTVSWQSVPGMAYYLQRSGNLSLQPAFSTVQSNLIAQAETASWTDTNALGDGPFFYRVGVR